jgi:AraC-like DNA-binding protein
MRERLSLPREDDGAVWHYARSNSTGTRREHTHVELEFNLVTRGSAAYLIQGSRVALSPGMLVWLFPSQLHLLVDQSPDFQMWIAVFRTRLVRRLANTAAYKPLADKDPGQALARRIDPARSGKISTLCQWYARQAAPDVTTQNAGLATILAESWSAYLSAPAAGELSELHPAVRRCIDRLLTANRPEKIQALARDAGVAVGTLSRLFKRDTGLSLASFRNARRLELFFDLWHARGHTDTLLQTALAAGFGSYPQFHRVYKRETGQSPQSLLRASRKADGSR